MRNPGRRRSLVASDFRTRSILTVGGAQGARRIAGHHRAGRNIPGDHRSRPYQGALADADAAQDRGVAADRSAILDEGLFHLPFIADGLAIDAGPRGLVIDEHHAMTDKHVVTDMHAFTDKSVRRNLAAFPDAGAALDLDKGADP